ncbi:MAG: uncharacterized protein JWO36_2157 [Myxococcales bacterium]|nr:uncharacterized protein [Myxococcales bacterium]
MSNGFVYWSDRVGGGVWRVPTAGGKPQRLASGLDQPRWIVPAFGKLFVSTEDHTISIPETGGAPRVVAPERDTLALGSDGVYIANDLGRLIRVDAQGVVTEVADHLAQPLTMAVVGTTVIWTATDHGIWKLMRGQKPIRLAILPTESVILAVHGEQAYVEAFDGQDLMAVPVGGGKSSAVLPALGETSSLTVDADGIWWTSMITNSVSGSSISHPTPHVMFDHQARATGIVTDRDALYWFTWQLGVPGHGRIMRAKKPSFARASSDQ